MNSLWQTVSGVITKTISLSTPTTKKILSPNVNYNFASFITKRFLPTLDTLHRRHMNRLENPDYYKKKTRPPILMGKPFAKGIVLRTLVKKPRKPNSANRKCVLVKLSIGKEMVAYVPGIGHNLQEHQAVLVKVSKLKDTPGVKLKCVRGKYDLPHVKQPGS